MADADGLTSTVPGFRWYAGVGSVAVLVVILMLLAASWLLDLDADERAAPDPSGTGTALADGDGDGGAGDGDGDDDPTAVDGLISDGGPSASAAAVDPAMLQARLSGAVSRLPGRIRVAVADGGAAIAVLRGAVANEAERREAARAAAGVAGVTGVRDELVALEPLVTAALARAGVEGATAIGLGTTITVSGTVDGTSERDRALAAARSVAGVEEIIDDRLHLVRETVGD